MSQVTSPIILDSTGQDIVTQLSAIAAALSGGGANDEMLAKVLHDPAGVNVSIGEYAIYNDTLYIANTAITASMSPSTFTSYLTPVVGGGFNSLHGISTGTVSAENYVNINSAFVAKRDNIVFLNLNMSTITTVSAGERIVASIPTDFAPTYDVYGVLQDLTGDTSYLLMVEPSGDIKVRTTSASIPSGHNIRGSIVYFII